MGTYTWLRAVSRTESCQAWALVNVGTYLWPRSSPFRPASRGQARDLLTVSWHLPRAHLSPPGPQGPRLRPRFTFAGGAHRSPPQPTSKWAPMRNSLGLVLESQNSELRALGVALDPLHQGRGDRAYFPVFSILAARSCC